MGLDDIHNLHIFAIMNMNEVTTAADEVCELMGLLSNKSRLMLLCLLIDEEKSFGELVSAVGAREPAVSQHLAVLRRQGIVKSRREGKSVIYSICDQRVGSVLTTLYGLYCSNNNQPKEI